MADGTEQTVDVLQIKITGESNEGSQALDGIIKHLEKVDRAISATSEKLKGLFNNEKNTDTFSESRKGADSFDKKIDRIKNKIDAFKNNANVRFDINKTEVEKGIGTLTKEIDRLRQAALFDPKVDIDEASRAIDDLEQRLKTSDIYINFNIDKEKAKGEAEKLKREIEATRINANTDEFYQKINTISEQLEKIRNRAQFDIVLSDSEAQSVVKNLESELENLRKQAFIDVNLNNSEVNNALSNVGNELEFTKMDVGLTEDLDDLAGGASKASIALAILGKVGKGALAGLKKLGSVYLKPLTAGLKFMTSAVEKLKRGISGILRIAKYRAIRFFLKQITEGFSEGVKNAYQFSKITNGPLAKSLDGIATSSLYLKNSLGAMVAPIINALAPAIDYITDKVVLVINFVNEFLAKATGKTTWMKAIRYPVEFAEAADDATSSVKKLKATILGIDEINPLNGATGGKNSSSANQMDYSKMFTVEQVSDNLSIDWTQLGTKVHDGITGVLNKIDEAINRFDWEGTGRKLAQFINGLDIGDAISTLGKTVSDALDGILTAAFSFADEFDWAGQSESITGGIADFFNGITETLQKYNFTKLGEDFADALNAAKIKEDIEALFGTLTEISSATIDVVIGFAQKTDFTKLTSDITTGVANAINNAADTLRKKDFSVVGRAVGNAITGIEWKKLLGSLGNLTGALIDSILDALNGLLEGTNFDTMVSGIISGLGEFLKKLFSKETGEKLGKLVSNAIHAVRQAMDGVVQGVLDTDWQGIGKAIYDFILGIVDGIDFGKIASDSIAIMIDMLVLPYAEIEALGKLFGGMWQSAWDWAVEKWESIPGDNVIEKIKTLAVNIWESFKTWVKDTVKGLWFLNAILEKWNESPGPKVAEKLSTLAGTLWERFKSWIRLKIQKVWFLNALLDTWNETPGQRIGEKLSALTGTLWEKFKSWIRIKIQKVWFLNALLDTWNETPGQRIGEKLSALTGTLWEKFKSWIRLKIQKVWFLNALLDKWDETPGTLTLGKLGALAGTLWEDFKKKIREKIEGNWLSKTIAEKWNTATSTLKNVTATLTIEGQDLIGNMFDGIYAIWQWFVGVAKSITLSLFGSNSANSGTGTIFDKVKSVWAAITGGTKTLTLKGTNNANTTVNGKAGTIFDSVKDVWSKITAGEKSIKLVLSWAWDNLVPDWVKNLFGGDQKAAGGKAVDDFVAGMDDKINKGTKITRTGGVTAYSDQFNKGFYASKSFSEGMDDAKDNKGWNITLTGGVDYYTNQKTKGEYAVGFFSNGLDDGITGNKYNINRTGGVNQYSDQWQKGYDAGSNFASGLKYYVNNNSIALNVKSDAVQGAVQFARLQMAASGGFPDEGQLFVAREAGPEMVGRIGSRTAVANTQQIVTGIADAVYEGNADEVIVLEKIYEALLALKSQKNDNGGGTSPADFARMNKRVGSTVVPVSV